MRLPIIHMNTECPVFDTPNSATLAAACLTLLLL